jgi:hypothetical protein
MICPQIPGGHGACGHGAAEGSRVGIRCARLGGEPREICEEGGDCGKVAESDAGGGEARGARGLENKLDRSSNATNLLNQEKKRKRSHSGDTVFVSYWHLKYNTSEVLLC